MIGFLTNNNIDYELDVSLKDISSFRIGGIADIICYPDTIEKVSVLIKYCVENSVRYSVFGKCSNVVFSDNGIKALIIKTDRLNSIELSDDTFKFGAGLMLAKASKFSVDSGYKGMEFAYGIPGSVGGAVYMNAGAYGGEMSECVTSVTFVDDMGKIRVVSKEELDFDYRHSYFSDKNYVIVSVDIKLDKGDTAQSIAKINEFQTARKDKQPLEFPSAGSVFKRPEGFFAGKLIQDCNLKGVTVGGAQVSEKHSGFIINIGDATCNDVKNLVKLIQERVKATFGVELECELKFIED